MDHFDLEGVTYYQQGRKCNKPDCPCAAGALHGPYWFSRDKTSGKVTYIGRTLPEGIEKTRQAHEELLPAMRGELEEFTAKVDALTRLMHHEALSDDDYLIIRDLGFENALLWKND